MTLHLDDTKELTLKPNSFNEIAKCDKPCKNNSGIRNFERGIINLPSPSLFKRVTLKSIEISFENQLMGHFENESGTVQENHEPPVKVSKSAIDDQSTDIPDNTSFFPDDVEVFHITTYT